VKALRRLLGAIRELDNAGLAGHQITDAIAAVLDRTRGVELLLGLCQENDDALVHRGVVCGPLLQPVGPLGSLSS
jgi:hypothetical protein